MKQMSEKQLQTRIDNFLQAKYAKYPDLLSENEEGSIPLRSESIGHMLLQKLRTSERWLPRHLHPHHS